MNRAGKVYYKDIFAGTIFENDEGFTFKYDKDYYSNQNNKPISLTLPLTNIEYKSPVLFSFFDGLIPEGYLYEIAIRKLKLPFHDRFGVLLKMSESTTGAVTVLEVNDEMPIL